MYFCVCRKRMKRFREKFSTFIFGVTVGLLIGCAVFIFKLDEYIKNFQFRDKSKESSEVITSPAYEKKTTITENNKKTGNQKKNNDNSSSNAKKISLTDSSSSGNTDLYPSSDDNISVLKEELISVKNIRIKTEEDQKINKKDSVLNAVSGIEEKASGDFLIVEFWKTPLNSKGYRMSRNKIVLYGLSEGELDVIRLDESFYLKHTNNIYKLEYSNEFKKMEKVSESSIIARLN